MFIAGRDGVHSTHNLNFSTHIPFLLIELKKKIIHKIIKTTDSA
jgi:hypothetical protein